MSMLMLMKRMIVVWEKALPDRGLLELFRPLGATWPKDLGLHHELDCAGLRFAIEVPTIGSSMLLFRLAKLIHTHNKDSKESMAFSIRENWLVL